MKTIQAQNVYHSYANTPHVRVLNDFSLTVEKGEFVAIQGPSGSGKSTLLYILGCLSRPLQGRVTVFDHDTTHESDERLAALRNQKIGFVFQSHQLLPHATLLENILLPTEYNETSVSQSELKKRALQLAASVGIADILHKYPNQVSGGQSQRAAICRALINDADLILADEPTGALDSKSAESVMKILKELHGLGKTIVLITHDRNCALFAEKIYHIKDGCIERSEIVTDRALVNQNDAPTPQTKTPMQTKIAANVRRIFRISFDNLRHHKIRSFLSMFGIGVGVASVLTLVSAGIYVKNRVLQTYAEMGIHTFTFYGYTNWDRTALEKIGLRFDSFDWTNDLKPLFTMFPQIRAITPNMVDWDTGAVLYGGKKVDKDVKVVGINEQSLFVTNRRLKLGTNITAYHVENKSPVCLIGSKLADTLFQSHSPLGEVIFIDKSDTQYSCRVLGVLEPSKTKDSYIKNDFLILTPFTFHAAMQGYWWQKSITEISVRVREGADVEQTGKLIQGYFQNKYKSAGTFLVSSNSTMIAQMNKFLSILSWFLALIAFTTLTVGSVGLTNMMLVSLSERVREIGLRKAIGASQKNVTTQLLCEGIAMCVLAGMAGLVLGFGCYEGLIYLASRLSDKVPFEWVFVPEAIVVSLVAIGIVGFISGLVPALKSKNLQIIDALRSE